MTREKLVQEKAEELQKECHSFVREVINYPGSNKDLTVQDVTNVWLFRKLAELQLDIESKQKKQVRLR